MKRFAYLLFMVLSVSSVKASDGLRHEPSVGLSSGAMAWYQKNPATEGVIIFIHGNSSSGKIFENQLNSPLFTQRLIAIDLPGHGDSNNAISPETTYSFAGYAAAIIEFMESQELKSKESVLCGWSLGGHIAIEILRLRPDLVAGLFITGTPPIDLTPAGFGAGFKPFDGVALMSKDHFTREDATKFVSLVWPKPTTDMIDDAERTHGIARSLMIGDALSGKGSSQKDTIENTDVPLSFVIGAKDEGINADYIKGLSYKHAPEIHELSSGHDTFFELSEQFNPLLKAFVEKVFHK